MGGECKGTVGAKFALQQVKRAQRGFEVQMCSLFDDGSRKWWVVNVTPRSLYPWGRDAVPILREVEWAQNRSGPIRKISPPPGLDSRTDQHVASHYTD
jgi:hypothetical protein